MVSGQRKYGAGRASNQLAQSPVSAYVTGIGQVSGQDQKIRPSSVRGGKDALEGSVGVALKDALIRNGGKMRVGQMDNVQQATPFGTV